MRLSRALSILCLLFLALVPLRASAVDGLAKSPGSWFWGPTAMWTAASTTTHNFFPMSPALQLNEVSGVRVAYQMTNDAGDCKLRAAVRFSSDGTTWETAEELNAAYSDANDEIIYNGPYIDLLSVPNTVPRSYVQFGIETVNRSTSTLSLCRGALRVEPRVR